MWTSNLIQIDADSATAVVIFTDGVNYKISETFNLRGLSSVSFRNQVESKRQQLEASYTFIKNIDVKTFNLAPDATPAPTADEQARVAYDAAFGKLLNMQRRISLGVGSATDKDFTNQQALVQSLFKPEYD